MILRGRPRGKVGRCRDFFIEKLVEVGLDPLSTGFFVVCLFSVLLTKCLSLCYDFM